MDITLFDFAKFALTRDDPKALILPCSLYLRMGEKKISPRRSPFVNTQQEKSGYDQELPQSHTADRPMAP